MADPQKTDTFPTLKWLTPLIPLIPILAAFGTTFWFGIQFAQHCSEEKEKFFQSQIQERDKTITELRGQLDQASERARVLEQRINQAPPTGTSLIPPEGTIRAQLLIGETTTVFSSQFLVSVVSIKPESKLQGYRVTAKLGATGKGTADFEGAVGDATSFAGFEVRIIQIDAASASFFISKLQQPSLPTQP